MTIKSRDRSAESSVFSFPLKLDNEDDRVTDSDRLSIRVRSQLETPGRRLLYLRHI